MKYSEDWYVYSFVSFGQGKVVFSNLSEKEIEEMTYRIEHRQELGELGNKVYALEIKIIEEPLEKWLRKQELISKQLGMDFLVEKITLGESEGYKIVGITKEGEKGSSTILSKDENVYLIETLFPERCKLEECKIFRQMHFHLFLFG